MREKLRNNGLARRVRFFHYAFLYRFWCLLVRPKPNHILFLSDSHHGFTGNIAFLRDEIRRQAPDAHVLGIFKPSLSAKRPLRDALRLPRMIAAASTVVLDDFYPMIYPLKIRRGTKLVQVWHAAGAFKQVGHSRAGLPGGPPPHSETHKNYTHAIVSSEAIRADYSEAFGITIDKVLPLGMARADVFSDEAQIAELRAETRAELGVAEDERLVVFAPTFRGNGQRTAYTDRTADWGRVAAELGDGWRVAVRPHPFTPPTKFAEHVLDAANGFDMTSVLAAADVLVTDYSSAIFEYALLRRPVVFFVPDLEDYSDARSFYRPFEDYLIGPAVTTEHELVEAIRTADVDDQKYDEFLNEFCSALDGKSTERIVRDVLLTSPSEQA